MITGYNTDVRHRDLVFHVQTEDKGRANPCVESMVYVGGQVLATKRSGYADLLREGKGEKDIVALMDYQHRLMIAAIRGGKLDDKLSALAARPAAPAGGARELEPPPAAAPAAAEVAPGDGDRTLDQVILDYLTLEAGQEQLVLASQGDADFKLGGRAALRLRATSSKSGHPVAGAQVTVKMISTIWHPRTLAAGETDQDGNLALEVEIPSLEDGVAALIITAASRIGNAELKHLL